MSTCAQETNLIGDYISGRMTTAARRAFEAHLHGCRDCAAFLHSYRKTIELTRTFLRGTSVPTQLRLSPLHS